MVFGYQIELKDEEKERKGVVTGYDMVDAVSDLTAYFENEGEKVINCLILIPLSKNKDYDVFDFEDRFDSEKESEEEDSPNITVKVRTSVDATPELDELKGLKEILQNLEKLN